jgi:hypothetical protein
VLTVAVDGLSHVADTSSIAPQHWQAMMRAPDTPGGEGEGVLLAGLKDDPRVASNVCYALHNLADQLEETRSQSTNPLSPLFVTSARTPPPLPLQGEGAAVRQALFPSGGHVLAVVLVADSVHAPSFCVAPLLVAQLRVHCWPRRSVRMRARTTCVARRMRR